MGARCSSPPPGRAGQPAGRGGGVGGEQEGIGRAGAPEEVPEAVRQAVGGDYQSGWGRLLLVTTAAGADSCGQGESGLA